MPFPFADKTIKMSNKDRFGLFALRVRFAFHFASRVNNLQNVPLFSVLSPTSLPKIASSTNIVGKGWKYLLGVFYFTCAVSRIQWVCEPGSIYLWWWSAYDRRVCLALPLADDVCAAVVRSISDTPDNLTMGKSVAKILRSCDQDPPPATR